MGNYAYQSMNASGRIVRGTMDASSVPDLEMRLKRMDLDLIDCKPVTRATGSLTQRSIKRKDLINFSFHMEQLSAAGVPMLEGLIDLRDSLEAGRFREVVANLIESIEAGANLSEALAQHPKVFDQTFSSLIMAGERSGQLTEVFRKITDNLKWQDELAAQTKKLVMYPAFVGSIVVAVSFFLMIVLVPQIVGFIKSMGGELPLNTRILIALSDLLVNYWYAVLAAPLVAAGLVVYFAKTKPAFRFWLDGFKLRVWLIGPILQKIILARFSTFFGLMYASGITVLDCMTLSAGIVDNQVIAKGLASARQNISEGLTITAAFQQADIFPPLVIRMLKVGEATGSLDTALTNVSYFFNREVKESIEKVQQMIEPAMTVVLGLLLGWIAMSVLGPIYDLIAKIKT